MPQNIILSQATETIEPEWKVNEDKVIEFFGYREISVDGASAGNFIYNLEGNTVINMQIRAVTRDMYNLLITVRHVQYKNKKYLIMRLSTVQLINRWAINLELRETV